MIEPARVFSLHLDMVSRTGEPTTVLKQGCVEGAVGAAKHAILYLDEDPIVFAACVLFYLTKGHCFEQGNKRTAWATAIDVLHENMLQVDATDDEVVNFVEGVASRDAAVEWFQSDGRVNTLDTSHWPQSTSSSASLVPATLSTPSSEPPPASVGSTTVVVRSPPQ